MASSSKKKTTFAKLNRENAVRERRLRKQAKKDARKQAAALPDGPADPPAGSELAPGPTAEDAPRADEPRTRAGDLGPSRGREFRSTSSCAGHRLPRRRRRASRCRHRPRPLAAPREAGPRPAPARAAGCARPLRAPARPLVARVATVVGVIVLTPLLYLPLWVLMPIT